MKTTILLLLLFTAQGALAQSVLEQIYKGEAALDPQPVHIEQIPHSISGVAEREVVVLIHGLGGSMQTWKKIRANLERDYRVLIYDQRGHGASQVDRDHYSSSTMASDLRVLLDGLKISAAHLVGHSMGGRTAMRFASEYPERTLSVTVEDMHLKGRSKLLQDHGELARKIRPLYRPSFSSAEEFYRIYQPHMKWELYSHIFHFGYSAEPGGEFRLYSKPHISLLYSQQGLQEDLTSTLIQSRKTPLMFLAAEIHPVLFGIGIDHILEHRPDAQMVFVPNSDHSIHAGQSMAFLSELRSWLQKNKAERLKEIGKGQSCQDFF